MSILNRLTDDEIKTNFTHYALFVGFLPVYFVDEGEGCRLQERNWIPQWAFAVTEFLFGIYCTLHSMVDPHFEPSFPITLTGEIPK